MELFRTDHFYIFISGEHSLWFDRFTGQLTPKSGLIIYYPTYLPFISCKNTCSQVPVKRQIKKMRAPINKNIVILPQY